MAAPQISLNDYSERSIVLRADPEDFFRPYSSYLRQIGGKWNRNLRDPSGQGRQPGWIFSKKWQDQVQAVIGQIERGELAPQQTQTRYRQTFRTTPQSIVTPSMSFPSRVTPSTMITSVPPSAVITPSSMVTPSSISLQPTSSGLPAIITRPPTVSPVSTLPGGAPKGYQQIIISVLKPEEGQTLSFNTGGRRFPVTVQSISIDKGIVNKANVRLTDGQVTQIELINGKWQIPGFTQEHTITEP